jgi:hypothetical protein
MGNKRWQVIMTPQRVKNYATEDLMDNEGTDNSVYKFKRMIIRMFQEFKDNIKIQEIPRSI